MRNERTSVGLDVHARSVVAAALDGVTGEVQRRRLTPDPGEITSWVQSLPGPVRVAYEAGPTGFGLARFLTAAGVECLVAAPSKLQRPSGDRVKTDARDALHLARLLKLGEIVEVVVPSVAQEAARDLVRAREDARADLMRARHRLSKLLLRQGIVYSGGQPWTGRHDRWLRTQAFDRGRVCSWRSSPPTRRCCSRSRRRDRLDTAITEHGRGQRVHRCRAPAVLPAWGLDVDRVRAGGGDRGLAPVHRRHDRGLPRPGPDRALLWPIAVAGVDHQDREHPRPPVAGRGRVAPPPRLPHPRARRCGPAGSRHPPAARARGHEGNRRLHHRWQVFNARKKKPVIANVAVARELAGWCWSLATLE